MGILHQQAQQKPKEEQKQQNKSKDKHKGGSNNKPNQVMYLGKVAWRFYSKLLSEAVLGAILMAPIYGIAVVLKLKVIEIPVNFVLMWAIGTLLFILQGLMFKN